MAIWANRPEVSDLIYLVILSNIGQRNEVMNVDVSFGKLSIEFGEFDTANVANRTIVFDADAPCLGITFVNIHGYATHRDRAFKQGPMGDFLRLHIEIHAL